MPVDFGAKALVLERIGADLPASIGAFDASPARLDLAAGEFHGDDRCRYMSYTFSRVPPTSPSMPVPVALLPLVLSSSAPALQSGPVSKSGDPERRRRRERHVPEGSPPILDGGPEAAPRRNTGT